MPTDPTQKLRDDCFVAGPGPLGAMAALGLLAERVVPVVAVEIVPTAMAAGRVLAADLVAAIDLPPADNAAVDGFAFRHADLARGAATRFRLIGRAPAGHPFGGRVGPGEAVRVLTGAPVPAGADTIVMHEDVALTGDELTVPPGAALGANRRRTGEDVMAGTTVLRRGRRLRPQDAALAAALGEAALQVFRPLSVAVFSSGDELRDVGGPLPPGCIYDANRVALVALLTRLGCRVDDLGILPDDARTVRAALAAAAGVHDLVVASGGMSGSETDHVQAAVAALGGLHFWKLAIKPGKPIAFGHVAGTPFIGLPGNPGAAMVTFLRFARPVVLRLSGADWPEPALYRVRAGFDHAKRAGRREWLRARLVPGPDGPVAARQAGDGAGILSSLAAADGLVELGEGVTEIQEGSMIDFLPFAELW